MKKNMNKLYTAIGILLVLIVIVATQFKMILDNTKLGLDLQGGIEILYKVEPIEGEELNQAMMDSTIDVLERRINTFGISETVISQEGDDLIRIQVPGVDDQSSARELLGSSAVLTFRDSSDNFLMGSEVLKPGKAKLYVSSTGQYGVELGIADPNKMSEVTGNLVGQQMVIWLDFDPETDSYESEKGLCGTVESNCVSAAVVQSQLSNQASITGNFTEEEAQNLVSLINSGSLQVNLDEVYSTSISASFGEEALSKSAFAAIVGLGLIMLFMTFKYRVSGLISAIALLIYTFVIFVIFYIFGGVLTLPGIAALVLGVGMAVDANVISFERVKDEIAKGENIHNAFYNGNKKSLLTIVDANITTAIIAIILFFLGATAIKGFATMLLINIATTFIITVFFTRFILKLLVESNYFDGKEHLFNGYSSNSKIVSKFKSFNYINKNKICFTFSLLLILVGMGIGMTKGFNVGLDFTSGTGMMISVDESDFNTIENEIDSKYEVVDSNYVDENSIGVIRVTETLSDVEINELTNTVIDDYDGEISVQKVSPLVGDKLIKNGIYSLAIAIAAITLYITIRFRGSFAIASIVALLHDLFMMLAMFAIFRFTLSGDFVAALLAILGYSINDTIVLFDRIRDNINFTIEERDKTERSKNSSKKKGKKKSSDVSSNEVSRTIPAEDLRNLVNDSVRETIGRSLTTSFTTLIPVLCLIFLGAREILEFNIALAIGLIFGTYSSIFIAAQVWLVFERKGYFYGKKSDGWFTAEETKEKFLD